MRPLAQRTAGWLIALAFALSAAPTPAQAQQPDTQVALISLSSYDEIKSDVSFVGRLSGQPQLAEQMEGMLTFLTGGQGLAGLDKTRPLGVVVYIEQGQPAFKALIPVSDMGQLTDLVANWGIMAEEGENGLYELTTPGPMLFAKESSGWAVVGMSADAVQDTGGADEAINTLAETYDLGIRLHVQNIPDQYRMLATDQIRQGMQQGMTRLPEESDEQFEMRKTITENQVEQIVKFVEESDAVTLGWSLDGREARTYLDIELTAVAGTELADTFARYENLTTNYAGFYDPDAAATLTFAAELTSDEIDQLSQMSGSFRSQIMREIDENADLPDEQAREVVKSAVGDIFDAVLATLKEGKADGGVKVDMSPNGATLVAGGLIRDPAKVESGLKKLEALAEEDEEFPGIQWNADSHGGIGFHTMEIPVPEHEEEARQLFGENLEVVIGTGGSSVYLALGTDAADALRNVIQTSQDNPNKAAPPLEMTIALAPILSTMAKFDADPVVAKVAEMLESEAPGRDHIRFVEHAIENGMKARLELEEGVLRAMGTAAEEERNAQQQGGF